MTDGYLVLVMLVATILMRANRPLRSAGTVLTAAGLVVIAALTVLANLGNTFAGYAAQATGLKAWSQRRHAPDACLMRLHFREVT